MSLMGSLGLENVESDPNAIPDGKYNGEVFKDEYVFVQSKDEVAHVLTYRVTEGPHKGAQRTHWFTLGKNPVRDEHGNIVSVTVTMDDTKKRWYKKAFIDLGVSEQDVPNVKPGDQIGKQIVFGVKRKDGYVNINFVELRTATAQATPGQTGSITGAL